MSNLVKYLPDIYAKNENSNNYKLLQIVEREFEKRAIDNKALLDMLDLDNCTGKTLDLYGEMFNQSRGAATDDQYRYMIRAKIACHNIKSDYQSIVDAICLIFNCDYSEFKMKESDLAITVEQLPLSAIINAGLTFSQAASIVKKLTPAGVTLKAVSFEGTLEFSENENEANAMTGFTDEDGHTMDDDYMGGYFGFVESYENESVLPI